MSYVAEVVIPRLPKAPNVMGKASIWATQKERVIWRRLINHAFMGIAPKAPLTCALVKCVRVSASRCDDDNLGFSFKHVLDALTFNGIIKDDSPKTIRYVHQHEKGKRGQGKIKIFIRELENLAQEEPNHEAVL